MPTITLTKENFGKKMSSLYKELLEKGELKINIDKKIDPTVRIHEIYNDPENTSYGPFSSMKEAVNFLNSGVGR